MPFNKIILLYILLILKLVSFVYFQTTFNTVFSWLIIN